MDQAGIGMIVDLTGAPLRRVVLAVGADMKNAVAMGYDRKVVLSPLTGALDTPEAVEHFEQVAGSFPGVLGRTPDTVAVDLHPDMESSRFGRKLAQDWKLPLVEVQHHHAHAAACLSENGLQEGFVLVMDGTGWGGDGTIWGAELLEVKGDGTFCRVASFSPVLLPGACLMPSPPCSAWLPETSPMKDSRQSCWKRRPMNGGGATFRFCPLKSRRATTCC